MKIIGITGKSGAGKTTLAEFFGERKNIGVVHIDEVLDQIKENKFKRHIKERAKNNSPKILSNSLRFNIQNSRVLFKASMFLKKILMKKSLQEAIKKFRQQGKDAVVIEGVHLKYVVDYKMFDKIIYVRRPYKIREKALLERDEITKEEILERDLPFKKKFSSVSLKNFDYVVNNIYGKEDLKAASQKIYDEVVRIKTFDEKYIVSKDKLISMSKNITKGLRKSKEAFERERRKS